MSDCSSASSVAISASRSVRPVDENGSTATKSTVPATVVCKPSIGTGVTVRIPDSPAVSFAQLSALPAPSEVTMPMPVTTTIGLPNLSRGAVMFSPPINTPKTPETLLSLDRLDEGHAFAPPVTGPNHYNLGRRFGHFNLSARGNPRRKQRAAREPHAREPHAHAQLGFPPVA